MRIAAAAALLITWAVTSAALAADPLPDQYRRGAATSVETAQTVDGSAYTVISPIFLGGDGNLSYVRFTNRGAAASTTVITIMGWPNGTNYGDVNLMVSPHSAPQYSINDILSARGIAGPSGGDTGFSLYLKNGDANAGFEHVIYSTSTLFFEDMSMCAWKAGVDYSDLNSWIFNIHTTKLPTYPAQIFLHNYGSATATFLVDVYEARFGTYKGTVSFQAAGNASYGVPFSFFQNQVGWTPNDSEMHANLHFRAASGAAAPTLVVGQAIYNQSLQAYVNMSQSCPINP